MFWSRRLVGVLAVVVALMGACSAVAQASGRVLEPGALRVATPSSGAVVLGRSARVVVDLGSAVQSFHASVNRHVVTTAFRSLTGGRRAATLRYGKHSGLRFGHNKLSVRGRDRSGRVRHAHVSFVLARRASGLIAGAAARHSCGAGASLKVVLARHGLRVRVAVNGHVRQLHGSSVRHTLKLDADDGLRPGHNVIVVRALDADHGVYSQRRLRLLMPKDLPVAGAGPARRGKVGDVIHFTAASSVAPPGVRLHYHWVLVSRPKGSKARLQDANTAHPFVRPDRPGRYTARVTVTPVGGPPTYTGVRGIRTPPCAARGSSSTTTLDAGITVPPLGIPIDTIANEKDQFGVLIGGDPSQDGSFISQQDPADALQLVVLNRYTLGEDFDQSFPNTLKGAANLLSLVNQVVAGGKKPDKDGNLTVTPSEPLVVISRPDPTVNNYSGDASGEPAIVSDLVKAMAAIGVSPTASSAVTHLFDTQDCASATVYQCGSFSAIGVAGSSAGDATLNPGLPGVPGSDEVDGDVHGNFMTATHELAGFGYPLVFVDHDRVPFDTGAPDADPAVVTVGSNLPGSPVREKQYTSDPDPGGFFVVVLNAGSLQNRAFLRSFVPGAASMDDMDRWLKLWVNDPAVVVIVRSIGHVTRDPSPAWDAVAADLQQLGGSKYYFDALNGHGGAEQNNEPVNGDVYAQVGPGLTSVGYPGAWTQVATQAHNGSGRLIGLLARNSVSQWYPDESAPIPTDPNTKQPTTDESTIVNRALDGTLPGLISLPYAGLPDRELEYQPVLKCVAAQENISYPIEDDYYNNTLIDWTGKKADLDAAGYFQTLTARKDCGQFTEAQFDTVKTQLDQEWADVVPVRNLFNALEEANGNPGSALPDVKTIVDNINDSIKPPNTNVSVDPVALTSDVFTLLALVPGPQQVVLGLAAGALQLGSALSVNDNGGAAGDVSVKASDVSNTGAQLASDLATRYQDAAAKLDSIYAILVSDWPKLQQAATNIDNGMSAQATADWKWDPDVGTAVADQLKISASRVAYQTLMPLAYRPYRLMSGTGDMDPSDPGAYQCVDEGDYDNGVQTYDSWKPFYGVSSLASQPVVADGAGHQQAWVLGQLDDTFATAFGSGNGQANPPSDALMQQMFNTPQVNGAPLFGSMLQFDLESYPGTDPGEGITHYSGGPSYNPYNDFCKIQ